LERRQLGDGHASEISSSAKGGRRRLGRQARRHREERLKGASKSMEKSMNERELDDLASTKRKGKPEHVTKS